MRWTVPVPMPSDLATFKIPKPFASCLSREPPARFNPPRAGLPQTSPWLTPRGRSRQRGRAPFSSVTSSARLRTRFRGTGVTEYWIGTPVSFGLDVGGPDHLAPLLGFVGDELTKVRGRAHQRRAAHVSKPRFHVGVCEGRVGLLVEPFDDFGGR